MSAFAAITSAMPPKADIEMGAALRLLMTQSGPDTTLFHRTLHSTFATRSVVISSRAMDP